MQDKSRKSEISMEIRTGDVLAVPAIIRIVQNSQIFLMCWLRTKDGLDIDIVFDEFGAPVTNMRELNELAENFQKFFQPVMLSGGLAYAHILTP